MNWKIRGTIKKLKVDIESSKNEKNSVDYEFELNYKDIINDKILVISDQENPPIDSKLIRMDDYCFKIKAEQTFLSLAYQHKLLFTLILDEENYKKLEEIKTPINVKAIEFINEK